MGEINVMEALASVLTFQYVKIYFIALEDDSVYSNTKLMKCPIEKVGYTANYRKVGNEYINIQNVLDCVAKISQGEYKGKQLIVIFEYEDGSREFFQKQGFITN